MSRISEGFLVLALLLPAAAHADVRSEERTQVKFEGGLGRVVNMFGGRGAREGVVTTVIVKGDRRLSTSDATGQIVDLSEEKVYDLDLRRKTYTVTTFAEMRRRIEEAREKAAAEAPREEREDRAPDAREVEMDFDVKETGQRRTIGGFDAREVVTTVTAREKGKTLEEAGGMVVTTTSWLTEQAAALKEVADFERRYAEKLHGPTMIDAQQMAMAAAMYPMLGAAMSRMQKENVNLEGTPVLTVMKVEAVKGAQPAAAAEQERAAEPPPASVGGLAGRLGRRVMRRDSAKDEERASADRATVLTIQHEVLKVTPAAADADLAIPAGFTQK